MDVEQCQNLGASMNLVDACPQQNDKSCQVSCQDPTSSSKCVVLDSTLVDGSPCGYGGMCYNGTCESGGIVATAEVRSSSNLSCSVSYSLPPAGLLGRSGMVRRESHDCYSRNRRRRDHRHPSPRLLSLLCVRFLLFSSILHAHPSYPSCAHRI